MLHNAALERPRSATYDTADVAEVDRSEYWLNVLSRYFGRLQICSLEHQVYGATLTAQPLAFLQTFRIRGRQFRVWNDSLDEESACPGGIKLLIELRGTCMIEQEGRAVTCEPGGWVLFDPSRPYVVNNLGDVEHVIVLIPRSRILDRRFPRLAEPLAVDGRHFSMGQVISSFVLSCLSDAGPRPDGFADYLAETTVGLLRCHLSADGGYRTDEQSMPDILRLRIRQYIGTHLADPELSIDQVAAAMGCSKRYLHMVFESEETTIERLIWRQRIDRCRRALADPSLAGRSISEIAYRWGFNSNAHFCRMFKTEIGVSPTAYRRNAVIGGQLRATTGD